MSSRRWIDSPEPPCEIGGDHDWQSPWAVLGGATDNPGVQLSGAGVIYTEVCAHCGMYRDVDCSAEDGHEQTTYRAPDADSLAWIEEEE